MKPSLFAIVFLLSMLSATAYAADSISSMFTQGTGSVEMRVRSFDRDYDGNKKDLGESAIGGIIRYKSADLYGVSFGLSLYNSGDLGSSDNKGGYQLLVNDSDGKHNGFTKLGEAYLQGKWFNTAAKIGAQELDTPYANGHDVRMAPMSYKGASIVSNIVPNLEMSAYYITEFLDHDETSFGNIAKSYSDKMDDAPLIIAGAKYSLNLSDDAVIKPQVWYYNLQDGLDMKYVKLLMSAKAGDVTLSLEPSYLKQEAIGSKDGGDFSTYLTGGVASASAYGATLGLYYAKVGDDAVVAPWGHSKIITQQVLTSARAQEKSYGAKLGYNFAGLGAKGLSCSIFYAKYNAPDSGSKASYDESETDYDVIYKLQKYIKGMTLRARYAVIDTDGTHKGVDYTDTRFYVTYAFNFGGKNK